MEIVIINKLADEYGRDLGYQAEAWLGIVGKQINTMMILSTNFGH